MTTTRPPGATIPARTPDLLATMHRRWKEDRARDGPWSAARSFFRRIGEFLWESLPAQRRQRYGDAEYDWDHRVNTTSATVGWRERLLGQFHSGYQPTEPALFTEMMSSLKINFQEFTFIDMGSGKGRVLLMAADYPFHRIVGVELFPALHRVAQQNLNAYRSEFSAVLRPGNGVRGCPGIYFPGRAPPALSVQFSARGRAHRSNDQPR